MTTTSRGGNLPSVLFADAPGARETGGHDEDRSFARDLNLDQMVAAIAGDREERDLITETLFGHLRDADAVRYRQELFRDLEDPGLLGEVQRFTDRMTACNTAISGRAGCWTRRRSTARPYGRWRHTWPRPGPVPAP